MGFMESRYLKTGYEQAKRLGVSLFALFVSGVLLLMTTYVVIVANGMEPARDFPFDATAPGSQYHHLMKSNVVLIGTGYHIELAALVMLALVTILRGLRVILVVL